MKKKTELEGVKPWKRYPVYKDSGIEWLGEIPEHWGVMKLKNISKINISNVDKKSVKNEQQVKLCNYIDVYYNDFITDDSEFLIASASEEQIKKFLLKEGDVIITKDSESWDDIAIPAYISKNFNNVLCGYHLAQIRPDCLKINGKYLFRSISATRLREQFWIQANGITRYGLSKIAIKDAQLPVPPLSEQQAIAQFLDQETTKIDSLVAKKERLIELLKEKRTALISHVVTKGLNPNVPLKDSGIEWLGAIPEHWEVRKLKHLITESLQYGANESGEINNNGYPRYIRITDIKEDGTLRDDTFRSLPHNIAKPYLLKAGDLLFARSGATVGKSFMYQESWGKACYAGYLIRARLSISKAIPEFISYFLNSSNYWNWLSSSFIQATIQNVSAEKYANLLLPAPNLSEQQAIAQFLDQETTKIDTLVAKTQTSIEKLKEYRTALISAVVTGKIDIREEV